MSDSQRAEEHPSINDVDESERLRTPEQVTLPDSRSASFVRLDATKTPIRPVTLQDRYLDISRFVLNATVPKSVRIHFETAKNLYLYAWYVYRFHAVAEQQALATLEFALRERLFGPRSNDRLGLRQMLEKASKEGLIHNDGFTARDRWARSTAERRQVWENFKKMVSVRSAHMAYRP